MTGDPAAAQAREERRDIALAIALGLDRAYLDLQLYAPVELIERFKSAVTNAVREKQSAMWGPGYVDPDLSRP